MFQKTLRDYQSTAIKCPECGNEYDTETGMKKHYGRQHEGSLAGVAVKCDWCGDTFRKKKSNVHNTNFCCKEHHAEWQSENITGELTNLWEGGPETVSCDWCEKEFERKPSHVRENVFCSQECHGKWQSENLNGQDNHAWNGGVDTYRALRAQLPGNWDKIKERVRERDAYECQMCGADQSDLSRALDVHHIVPIMSGGTHGEWNLISLCLDCHQSAESVTREVIEYNVRQHKSDGGGG